MAIDPTIFLRGYQGPVDTQGIFTRAQLLRDQQQRASIANQLGQQQIQEGQMRLNQIGKQVQDQEAMKQAAMGAFKSPAPQTLQQPTIDVGGASLPGGSSTVQGPAQFDPNAYVSNLNQAGLPMEAMGFQQQHMAQQLAQQKAQADLDHVRSQTLEQLSMVPIHEADRVAKSLDNAGKVLTPMLDVPDEQYQQIWQTHVLPQLAQISGWGPQQMQQHAQAPPKDELQAQIAGTQAGIEYLKNKQAEADKQAQLAMQKRGQDITLRGQNMVDARAREANAQKFDLGGQLTPEQQDLVDQIGQGKVPLTRLDYLATRNPGLLAAVSARYPDFDGAKIKSYVDATKDFTSGKTAVMINAGATALGHLKELQELNTNLSHIPHTPDWTKYQNKVDTVAAELAKFYGDATIPAINAIKSTLGSTLPGNREAAIQTQAQSMGDKLDSFEQQWKNAAPSAKYQADMPGMSEKAKAARAALDPNYAANATVTMVAPDGTEKPVPITQVDHYKSLGAKVK